MTDDNQRPDSPGNSEESSFEDVGTEEMDREALLRRMQVDAQRTPAQRIQDTLQLAAVSDETLETVEMASPVAKPAATQHYTVPESLLAESREIPTEQLQAVSAETTTFSTAALLEFETIVDADGRISLPTSALHGTFAAGKQVRVVVVPLDES